MRSNPRRLRRLAAVLAIAGIAAVTGGCAANPSNGVTTLNFFQFKGEALEDFNKIISDFEAENPDIRVVQNQVADADTVIRTLLVKDKAPDVITLNANGGFGKLAQAGVFYDFSDAPVLQTINPAVQEILQLPDGWMVRTVMALGHPTDAARQPKSPPGEARLPREAVVFRERLPGE